MTDPLIVAAETIQKLSSESKTAWSAFWVRPDKHVDELSSDNCRFFQHAGFVHVPAVCSLQECATMKTTMSELVHTQWNLAHDLDSFGTTRQQNEARGNYFLESSERVHFFAETCALVATNDVNANQQKQQHQQQLRPEYNSDDTKINALNKVGHALHTEPTFCEYSYSNKIQSLVSDLGWTHPVIPQSMYIFKRALQGSAVSSHQDSTFLFTEPRQTCLGLWLALDDATLQNGCLWVRPKSHGEAVRRRYKRNAAYFGDEAIASKSNVPAGDSTAPMFVMEELYEHSISWDGGIPGQVTTATTTDDDVNKVDESDTIQELLQAGFIPIECKAGDLLAFCGELDHLSLPNRSTRARHTFQLHLVEGPDAGIAWSKSNWLQYGEKEFETLNKEK
jgi:phytanoyl-CoA hydroxylase